VPDATKLGWISEQEKVWNIEAVNQKTNFDFLKDQVQHVQKIYFAGGEPLLMDEHWQILQMLVDAKRFDVKINYNTNASTLTYGKKNAIDYWKHWEFGKLEVWPSIDEIGERAELIRAGTVWSKVEANLKELSKHDNIIVRPGITVGAWNVFRLPEIIQHFESIGLLKETLGYKNFFINLLETPAHYHVSILPEDYRQEIIKKIEDFVAEHNKKHNTSMDHLFTHIIHELKKPWDEKSARKFVEISKQLDAVRDEDIYKVIPEMQIVRDAVNG
jgi:sulfatase maturation enzyme AslB (radical SAM superfamily)